MRLSSEDLELARVLFDRSGHLTEAGRRRFDDTQAEIDRRWREARRRALVRAIVWGVVGLAITLVFWFVEIPWESQRVQVIAWVTTVATPLLVAWQAVRAGRAGLVRDTALKELADHREQLRQAAMRGGAEHARAVKRSQRVEKTGSAARKALSALRRGSREGR